MISKLKDCDWIRICEDCVQNGCQWTSSQCVKSSWISSSDDCGLDMEDEAIEAVVINDWFPLLLFVVVLVLLLGGLAAGILYFVYRTMKVNGRGPTAQPLRFSLLVSKG